MLFGFLGVGAWFGMVATGWLVLVIAVAVLGCGFADGFLVGLGDIGFVVVC